jgi:hypothetical protein
MKLENMLGVVFAGLKAAPYLSNHVSQVVQNIDRSLPFGQFGDVSSSNMCIVAENVLT